MSILSDNTDDAEEAGIFYSNGGAPLQRDGLRIDISSNYNRMEARKEDEVLIDTVWEQRTKANSTLYNGMKFRLHSFEVGEGFNLWKLGHTNYKEYLGTNMSATSSELRALGERSHGNTQTFLSDPIGVGALLITKDDRIILLERSTTCAESGGLLDVPGGHPEPNEQTRAFEMHSCDDSAERERMSDVVVQEVFDSILKEIVDEVNIPLQNLSEPLLMGIIFNRLTAGRASAEFIIRCSMTSEEVCARYRLGGHAEADESTSIRTIPLNEVLEREKGTLWDQFAPSAKGCFTLYCDFDRRKDSLKS